MNKEQFKNLINNYKLFGEYCDKYYELGLDLYESKYPIPNPVESILDVILESTYDEKGVNWINWFMYENQFGESKLEAYDGDKLICQNLDDLYDYIEQYKK